ncbi:Phosphoenolpyruvate carboxylase [Sinobacterium norvegicum]|uniref:Phosphoenolpyruvate carboxylase n=1 Tax=Sinobacterium norvegicum TaxID=1641715 RepID=A0ABM9ACL5_9GAMM|nr:phosphoenolpyruvate carboxylase [Sinobacterium norvegicum]CAH0990942.1 Phosphoenolpyruvate carboxylase [Sinobacterium norvegicum]
MTINKNSETISQALSHNVDNLGRMLGQAVSNSHGEALLSKIETIRNLAKTARADNDADRHELLSVLQQLDNEELLPVARAFSQFLNLVNISDQHHAISREMADELSSTETLKSLFSDLKQQGVSANEVAKQIENLNIELVLTAHPTEITRRSLIHKYTELDTCLGDIELTGYTDREQSARAQRLEELIAQIWHTDEFRQDKPSPLDEAKWGMAVLENSLWQAVPDYIRRLQSTAKEAYDIDLPITAAPISFVSWMGGDRDGNPNVTADITRKVLLIYRWKMADLYLNDIVDLVDELSMSACSEALAAMTDNSSEPYRAVMKSLRRILNNTLQKTDALLRGHSYEGGETLEHIDQLWLPLHRCYQSLLDSGMSIIANGKLLDLLRRVRCFGTNLVKLDIRQESSRHSACFAELTRYLGLGDYNEWSEGDRQTFLLAELQSKRPLFPRQWQPSAEVAEVLETCRVVAENSIDRFGGYVISMAKVPSDVLAVHLLLKESGCQYVMPVAPLFETLEDLNNAADVIEQLLNIPWYKGYIDGYQMVMIGYSDSAKDAGVLAAGWAQYRAQELLLEVCDKAKVSLMLFHGRGGTIGRGGAPTHAALLSQPPGSLRSGLRVTEQGEMIRAKLGLSPIAIKSFALYTSAILQANIDKPPAPKAQWRALIEQLADDSCAAYRSFVRDDENFVRYFRQATPEQELGKLPLGSRPSRRSNNGGIESLRAIPWIFAWSQNRLMLPAWLGAGQALGKAIDNGQQKLLEEMCRDWPFFSTRVSMLEMVFAKADIELSSHYDSVLVDADLQYLGDQLRQQLLQNIDTVLSITNDGSLMEDLPMVRDSVQFRNTYVDPLNLLQAELLRRNRAHPDPQLERAIMATIAGIAAGLRNTG